MLPVKLCLLLVLTCLVFCESAFVDNLYKCKINDGECGKDLIQSVIRDIAKPGVPELKIPPTDPIQLKNIILSVAGTVNITLIDGTVKGIKDCVIDKFFTDVKKERAFVELTCDITLKTSYKLFSNSPIIKTFLGGESVHGDGNMRVKIEKLHIRFDYSFYIQKRSDDIYIKCKSDKPTFKYDVLQNMNFFLDNLYLGKEESSQLINNLMNQNWKLMVTTFGTPFMNKAMELFYDFLQKFYDNVPVKYFILDDLTKYARE